MVINKIERWDKVPILVDIFQINLMHNISNCRHSILGTWRKKRKAYTWLLLLLMLPLRNVLLLLVGCHPYICEQ